ncbi:hypothetical protein [Nocardioides sp.]|uniref:hypothetical protein n=1 Tax=Nocardioides sp. TaxID=35761 RepID=UPI001A23C867|nr:hypothetical protein [Nocardioides sp.]MBJ7358178.1 hypothetical protein [Nocardioides sp.]
MTAGARKADGGLRGTLLNIGGAALAVALLATAVILLVFGDHLVSDDPPSTGDQAGPVDTDRSSEAPPDETDESDEVVEAATAVLDTWSQPALRYDEWWQALEPLLTPGGREAYSFTDPTTVPELTELAADHVVLNPSGATATVWFETSDGVFGVDLSRKSTTDTWLANRVVFPGEESMFA